MDISGVNAAAARSISNTSSSQASEQDKKVETQNTSNVTQPSPNEQRADSLKATGNQQVSEPNASTDSGSPDSSTSKPVVSDNINQALVQQAIAKPDAGPSQKGNADLDKKEAAAKADNKSAEAKTATLAEDAKKSDQAKDAAASKEAEPKSADGASSERVEF